MGYICKNYRIYLEKLWDIFGQNYGIYLKKYGTYLKNYGIYCAKTMGCIGLRQ